MIENFKKASKVLAKLNGCKYLLFLLTVLFGFIYLNVNAQTIKCRSLSKKVPLANDTAFTFENSFVVGGSIPNIKVSQSPVEIRLYITKSDFSLLTDLYTITGKGHTFTTSKKTIYMYGGKSLAKGDILSKDGKMASHVISVNNNREYHCNLIDSLIKHNLFTIKSVQDRDFSTDGSAPKGSFVCYLFEVKLGSSVRNIRYTIYDKFEDRVKGRKADILALHELFVKITKI